MVMVSNCPLNSTNKADGQRPDKFKFGRVEETGNEKKKRQGKQQTASQQPAGQPRWKGY
jgi:hypothetical protein